MDYDFEGVKTGQKRDIAQKFPMNFNYEQIFSYDDTKEELSQEKKMHKINPLHETPIFSFVPAQLKTLSSGWYIEYYAFNPFSNQMERQRIKCNKIKRQCATLAQARTSLKQYVFNLNMRLASGWSPFAIDTPTDNPKLLIDVLALFVKVKENEVRHESMRCYRSQVSMFSAWLVTHGYRNLMACDFTKRHALAYLDWISASKGVTNRTWNNYRLSLTIIFNWLCERSYCATNY